MIDVLEAKNTYISCFNWFEKSPPANGKPWLREIRKEAIASFSELGWPTSRDEEWRFTDTAPITGIPFTPARCLHDSVSHSDFANFAFGEASCHQLVFVDGCYSEALSVVGDSPEKIRLMNLADAIRTDQSAVESHLARYASFKTNAFAALNTAFMSDGIFLYVPPGARLTEPVHVMYLSTVREGPAVSYPRNLVVMGVNSQVTIVESYVGLAGGLYFTNAVTEIVAGDGCSVDHYKLQRESDDAFHIATMHFHQGRDSRITSHSISLGGALVRNDVHAVMDGEGGDCSLNGLYVTGGKQPVDNHTCIDHAKPHCNSRELYKGILDGQSTAVFTGKVIVRKDAQKTNAKQTNKNLLLSQNAIVNTTPQLEIFADDVKCTHGATVGQLDREALFYMRSRGIDAASARTLLTYAFASEILGTVQIKPVQCQIDLVLLAQLSRGLGGQVEQSQGQDAGIAAFT